MGVALVPVAAAHVTISPAFVEIGAPATLTFQTPNERAPHSTTSLELEAPPGVELGAEPAPSGWTLTIDGSKARWTGGTISGTDVVSFPLRATARRAAGTAVFRARQQYDDGAAVRWEASVTVVPAAEPGDEPSQHLGRALVAGVVGLAVLGGSFVALRLLRR